MFQIIMLALVLSPFVVLYYLRNKDPKWLWIFFILVSISFKIQIGNAFLDVERVFLHLTSFILAIAASRNSKKSKRI